MEEIHVKTKLYIEHIDREICSLTKEIQDGLNSAKEYVRRVQAEDNVHDLLAEVAKPERFGRWIQLIGADTDKKWWLWPGFKNLLGIRSNK
eukprot:scaffold14619_cov146-Amphora_coffeaeformis.AAC.1